MNIAIYSRKSRFTGKGDSIENQIQLCKDHVADYLKIDNPNFIVYEDEGFSGGNTNRPDFLRLIDDIKSKKINMLICYRLDRISRNVSDFSSTLKILERNNVSFVSIREQFDTSTPMGKAMIYIASVFSQLERETIAERVRDNMLELAKNGRWSGGTTPLGYKASAVSYMNEDMLERKFVKLEQVKEELEVVKVLYNKYIELKSLSKLETFTMQHGYNTKKGGLFTKSSLRFILSNPVYVKSNKPILDYLSSLGMSVCGEPDGIHSILTYNKTKGDLTDEGKATKTVRDVDEWIAAVSSQEGVIEPSVWLDVQSILEANREIMSPNLGKTHNALLTSILKCAKCGAAMQINHGHISKKTNQTTYYYSCSLKKRSRKSLCDSQNIKVSDLDSSLLSYVKEMGLNKQNTIENIIKENMSKKGSVNAQEQILKINTLIKQKEKQIDNLVNKLSIADEDITELFINKIKNLKLEISEHKQTLIKINKQELDVKNHEIELSYIETLLDQCANINKLDKEMQQQIVTSLFKSITVDENGNVDIEPNRDSFDKKKVHL